MPLRLEEVERAGLRLKELPREGRCLVTDRAFAAGEVLLKERPLVGVSAADLARKVQSDPSRYELLRSSEAIAHSLLEGSDDGQLPPFLAEVETNSFTIGGCIALFHAFAMVNHACAGSWEENACFTVLLTGEQALSFDTDVGLVALRDLVAGEPVRMSYHELFADAEAKASRLDAHCGGHCGCSLCCVRGTERDLHQFTRVLHRPLACQQCGVPPTEAELGDLVQLDSLESNEYNGLHGRVLRKRADGRRLVAVLRQGRERQLWLRPINLLPLERGSPQGGAASASLQQCSRCSSTFYCSRVCQRADWRGHREHCQPGQRGWEDELGHLALSRARLDQRTGQHSATREEAVQAFERAERFVRHWTQQGRSPRLAAWHYAVQEAALLAVTAGTFALGHGLAGTHASSADLWLRTAQMAWLHQHCVLALVPRFHIAHWTILFRIHGLLSLRKLWGGTDVASARVLRGLDEEFRKHLDVARVFDPALAAAFGECDPAAAPGGEENAALFEDILQDPQKLARFQSIDPGAPLEERMKQMADLLSTGGAAGMPPRRHPAAAQPREVVLPARAGVQAAPAVQPAQPAPAPLIEDCSGSAKPGSLAPSRCEALPGSPGVASGPSGDQTGSEFNLLSLD